MTPIIGNTPKGKLYLVTTYRDNMVDNTCVWKRINTNGDYSIIFDHIKGSMDDDVKAEVFNWREYIYKRWDHDHLVFEEFDTYEEVLTEYFHVFLSPYPRK